MSCNANTVESQCGECAEAKDMVESQSQNQRKRDQFESRSLTKKTQYPGKDEETIYHVSKEHYNEEELENSYEGLPKRKSRLPRRNTY